MTLFVKIFGLRFQSYFSFINIPKKTQLRINRSFTVNIQSVLSKPIISVYQQALHTFDPKSKKQLDTNIKKLKSLMDGLTHKDVGFDERLLSGELWKKPTKAPCTYIEVFENDKLNMSVFVLKPGFRMPLHDHPKMHGLMKVIFGAVKIRSFTEFPLKKEIDVKKFIVKAKKEAKRISEGNAKKRELFAKISSDKVCRDNSESCILTPTVSNYHEIEALEMPAAFFDILSPPYDTMSEDIGPIRCHYYKIDKEISTNLVKLVEIDEPECFYCDRAPYLGPKLK